MNVVTEAHTMTVATMPASRPSAGSPPRLTVAGLVERHCRTWLADADAAWIVRVVANASTVAIELEPVIRALVGK